MGLGNDMGFHKRHGEIVGLEGLGFHNQVAPRLLATPAVTPGDGLKLDKAGHTTHL